MPFPLLLAAVVAIRLPSAAIVDQVHCGEWERGYNLWRTSGATVTTMDDNEIRLKAGDVTQKSSPDLWFTLELFCRDDLDGGMDGD